MILPATPILDRDLFTVLDDDENEVTPSGDLTTEDINEVLDFVEVLDLPDIDNCYQGAF